MLRKYNINGIFEGKNAIYFDDKKPLTKELVDIKKCLWIRVLIFLKTGMMRI